MNERKWTKGPWWLFRGGIHRYPGIEAKRSHTTNCSIVVFGVDDKYEGVRGSTHEESLANAHLISAAPDLYEVLEEMVESCPDCGGVGFDYMQGCDGEMKVGCETCSKARAALAKARGEA